MGWSGTGRDSRPFAPRGTAGARATMRVALVASESLAVVSVLAVSHHVALAWVCGSVALLLALSGLDRRLASRVTPRPRDLVVPVVERVGVGVLAAALFLSPSARADLLLVGVLAAATVSLARAIAVTAVRVCCHQGWLQHRVLIVGSGQVAARLAGAVLGHPGSAMRLAGVVDDDFSLAVPDVPRLGSLAQLEEVVRAERIDRILLAFSSIRETQLVRQVIACETLAADIYAVPRFFEVGSDEPAADQICGIPLILLPCPMQRRSTRALKRGFDVLGSLLTLAALSPVLVAVTAAVRLSGPRPFVGHRPVLFRQQRVGLDGREFTILKFRSMVPNDDGDRTWSVVGDPRVTGLGSFLRRSGLDEAPQLWNVLRGDMSLVGPRPERPLMANVFAGTIPEYQARLRVRPGITGWAQVNGLRGDTSIVDRARLDNYYVATWTFAGDLAILVRTALLLLSHLAPRRHARMARASTARAAELTGIAVPVADALTSSGLSAVPADLAPAGRSSMLHADAG